MRLRSIATSWSATAIAVCASSSMVTASPAGLGQTTLPQDAVQLIEMPGPDYMRLAQEDAIRDAEGLPARIAVPHEVSYTPSTSGTWELIEEDRMMWRLRVLSPGAVHLNFGFGQFELPSSAELTIYSYDGYDVMLPITAAQNPASGEHWTRVVHGEEVVIEITVDLDERPFVEDAIELTAINEGYRGMGGGDGATTRGSSEACNVDVVCPLGDDWWSEIPSVGVYTINGFLTCTGVMINNTNQDETPYFLTANHCGIGNNNDQSVVVYWNHQNSYCRTPGSGDSGGNGNGNYNQYTSGSQYLVSGNNSDYCLIRLNNDPNSAWEVTFSGWSRSTSTPSPGVGIHHPNTAEKRISSVDYTYSNGPYWGVNWGEGRTYYGSSGSPLYNANHQIVGQLYGGSSFCDNDLDDVYGKFSTSWSGLQQYLDPAGSNPQSLDTLNPYDGSGNGGVCCWNGICYTIQETTCSNVGGTWYADLNCGEVNCADPDPTGGCCVDTTCTVTTEANCTGTYLGDDTDCADDPCAPVPTGACCVSVTCVIYTADDCAAAGGSYLGDGSSCAGSPCGTGDIAVTWAFRGTDLVSGGASYTVDVYAETPAGWRIDAVAGNANQQKTVASTTSFYQDGYGGPTSQDVNPDFYPLAPELEWDSRVTIGALDSSGNPFPENALNNIGIDWSNFEAGGDLSVGDGTWFCLPIDEQGESQSFIDHDCTERNGVLVARLTTMEHSSEILFEALFQGRDAIDATWQDVAAATITYNGEQDCNENNVADACDIANGTSDDANGNGVPDECESGCTYDIDGDGDVDVDDLLEIINGFGSTYDVDDLLGAIAEYGCS
ncbi:MAG: hypothetical protein MK100_04845 [Phycisphaerales bacterium]|nr:hypothetical protein [Phycisphaerales bacterium]